MGDISKKIQAYLEEHGKMSGSDICEDMNVDECDIDWAVQRGLIKQVAPLHGGSGSWYAS